GVPAQRPGEEERDHDGRFRTRGRAARRHAAGAGDLRGLPAALPADHDDHHGGHSGRAAARAAPGRRRRAASAPRHRDRRRADPEPAAHALHDAGRLPVLGPLPAVVETRVARWPVARGCMRNYFLAVVVSVSGCAVGPDYRRPEIEAPAQFKEIQGWRPAEPRDAVPRGAWWSVFGDAELDALLSRVNVSNQNIRVAEARLRQARALADQARAALFPAVTASASATRGKSPSLPNQPSFAVGAVNNYNVALNTSWELDLWGRVRRSVEAGEASWQASAADLEAARLSARAALAQNYFALRVDDATRQLLEDTVAAY